MSPTARRPRIGILGGTFDPVHAGHLIIATEFHHALGLDRLLFVPAGVPPHKRGQAISDDADRLAMLRLALADNPDFEIDTIDLDRGGVSYTSELLALMVERNPGAEVIFLMGEDSLRDLPTWHAPEEICRLVEIGVAARFGVELDVSDVTAALPACAGRIRVVSSPEIGISSSDIRIRVATGQPVRYQVPRAVERYIRDRGLYLDAVS